MLCQRPHGPLGPLLAEAMERYIQPLRDPHPPRGGGESGGQEVAGNCSVEVCGLAIAQGEAGRRRNGRKEGTKASVQDQGPKGCR